MLAFQILVNGRKVSIAGTEDLAVLNAIVSAVGKLGKKTSSLKTHRKGYDLWLTVGGLTGRNESATDEHLRWIQHKKLKIGDRIEVRVCKTAKADAYVKDTPVSLEQQERLQFKMIKSQYMKLRKKFEKKKVNKSPKQTR